MRQGGDSSLLSHSGLLAFVVNSRLGGGYRKIEGKNERSRLTRDFQTCSGCFVIVLYNQASVFPY